jgi:hypothetical protein
MKNMAAALPGRRHPSRARPAPPVAVRDHVPVATEDDARELALALPETVERPSYGTPGFRVKDRLFARIREPGVLLVRVADEGEKDFLLRAEPEKFFTTPHYDGHPSVLVRLAAVDRDELAELLTDAWRARAPKRLADSLDP